MYVRYLSDVLIVTLTVTVTLVPSPVLSSWREELEPWRTACPYADLCTVNGSLYTSRSLDGTTQQEPCCSRCNCDKECWKVEDCCPDVTHTQPNDLRKANCTRLHVSNDFTEEMFTRDLPPYYRVLDFCPPEFASPDPLTKDKCEGRLVDDLDDVVAVSDAKNRIYKNKHCAKCHGANDVESWNLRLTDCRSGTLRLSIPASQYLRTILTNCAIMSSPPGVNAARFDRMLCNPYTMRSACRPGGNDWYSGLEGNVDRCINGPYMPYRFQGYKQFLYKNVFCFLCTEDSNEVSQNLCSVTDDKDDSKTYFGMAFTLLLDTHFVFHTDSSPKESRRCGETEIYDNIKERCVEMFCPLYSVSHFGQCLHMGGTRPHFTVVSVIRYQPQDKHYGIDGEGYDDRAALMFERDILSLHRLLRCDVRAFRAMAFTEEKTNAIAFIDVTFIIQSSDNCDFGYISNIARTSLSRRHNVSVRIGIDNLALSGEITFYQDVYHLYQLTSIIDFDMGVLVKSHASVFFLCPYYKVNIDEYNTVMAEIFQDGRQRNISDMSELTRVEEGFYVLNNDSIAVCTDTYFKLYRANTGTSVRMLESTGLLCYWEVVYMLIVSSVRDIVY